MRFADDAHFSFPAELLRVVSPSVENVEARRRLGPVQGRRNVAITRAVPVGRYAVNVAFDDRHVTGIYPWRFLRELGENKTRHMRAYLAELRQHEGRRGRPKS